MEVHFQLFEVEFDRHEWIMSRSFIKSGEKQEHTQVWSNLNDSEVGIKIIGWLIVGWLILSTDQQIISDIP